ncbi:efflux RND transporter periplasmic adaptor subunit [Aliiroseovarius sp. PTFE2010]|uniref:efflux RND transporter periplasmic adaptor subunit n=1 Tax=Aliiroseovarius sp. PTFE2010 TaxID=3417190 RepID=UPI003CF21B91
MSLTVGLLAWGGYSMRSAIQDRMAQESRPGVARERVFAVNVTQISPQTVTPVITAFGQVVSRRALELRTPVGGTIVELSEAFEEGGQVQAGDVLLRIDPTDAQATLDVAEADYLEAEATLRDAQRTLEIALDDLQAARDQAELRAAALARQQNLKARGVATDAAVEDAALAEVSARQSVLAKRQAVANAEAAVDSASTAVLRARIKRAETQRALDDTVVVAEFSGTLADVTVVEGGLVTANEQIGRLIDPIQLEVSFRVSAQQYVRLLSDDGVLAETPVRVALDLAGVDIHATGRITRESATVGEGQTGRLLFARLDDAAGFRPGDFVTVVAEEPALQGVARLPATAVDAANTVLALDEENRLQTRPVDLLRRQGDDVLISAAGLAGVEVVSERTPLLGQGILVRPLRAPDTGQSQENLAPDLLELTPERRAALIAFVKRNARMPSDVKERLLATLAKDKVPAETVESIEARMGG